MAAPLFSEMSSANPYIGSDRPYRDGPRFAFLVLESIHCFEKESRDRACYWFRDEHGRRIVWFSSRKQSWQVGEHVHAQFVVQSHRVFNGRAENLVKKFRQLPQASVPTRTHANYSTEPAAPVFQTLGADDSFLDRLVRWWNGAS